MSLAFSKMHGLGNDFVLLDCRDGMAVPDPVRMAQMANRHTGIGFDQLLAIEPPQGERSLASYRIWNADGSRAGQCGNGVRCVAAWLHRAGALSIDTNAVLDGPSGPVQVRVLSPQQVTVEMGEPRFEPARIPLLKAAQQDRYTLDLDTATQTLRTVELGAVSMGNPHAVVEVTDTHEAEIDATGPLLTTHAAFPEGCNAGFVALTGCDHLELRVHERGAGWTQACGTGACAAAAVMRQWGRVGDHVVVHLPGGSLDIDWTGHGTPLWMTGPAAFVFDGNTHEMG